MATVSGDSKVTGTVTFTQKALGHPVLVSGTIKGLDANAQRGFHVQYASYLLPPLPDAQGLIVHLTVRSAICRQAARPLVRTSTHSTRTTVRRVTCTDMLATSGISLATETALPSSRSRTSSSR